MLSREQAERIFSAIDQHYEEQLATTAKLVEFPSLRGDEEPAQDFLEQQFRRRGLEVDRWTLDSPELRDHPGYGKSTVDNSVMTNVVGTFYPTETLGKSLILNGHVDVVPEGPESHWSRSPWDAEIKDGWMYGRGAGDMKAGLIANLYAFDAIKAANLELTGRLQLQSVVEEECTGNGSLAALIRGYSADAVLISEPEEDSLVRANVGVLWMTIRVSGVPTHPREMTTGFNAIDAAYDVIGALRKLEEQWNAEKGDHPYFEDLEHPINFNVGEVRGGDWPSSVPAWCELRVRISTYPGTSADEALKAVSACVMEEAKRQSFEVDVTPDGFYAEGYVLEPGSQAEELLKETHQAAFATELKTFTTPGYLDARVFVNYGNIPTLVYGPVTEDIHGYDERVNIESLRKCTKSIALFAASWCGVKERS